MQKLSANKPFSLASEIPENPLYSKKQNMSYNIFRCTLRVMGVYEIICFRYINVHLLFLFLCARKLHRALHKPVCHAQCTVTYCLTLRTYAQCVRSTYSVRHPLFFVSQRSRPTHHYLWHTLLL